VNPYSSSSNRRFVTTCFRAVAIVLVLALSTLTVAPQAWSQDAGSTSNSEGGSASSAGMGVAAGLSSLLYFPLKAVFAIGGGIVGGLTYLFSGFNENAAKPVWTTSMYGTYIITPDHLRGDKPIRFLGVSDEPNVPAQATAPEPVR